jgi:hypothetical protein
MIERGTREVEFMREGADILAANACMVDDLHHKPPNQTFSTKRHTYATVSMVDGTKLVTQTEARWKKTCF